jgi:hypothetical protein
MRFTQAWAEIASQNSILKIFALVLCGCCLVLTVATAKLALKDPLVFERGCYTIKRQAVSAERSTQEIETFLKMALAERFDTGAIVIPGHLSAEEEGAKQVEQKELSQKGMTQRVVIGTIKVDKTTVEVDADRLISVSQIRSAFAFPLVVTIATATRSDSNPYGLLVVKISQKRDKPDEK